MFDLDVFADLAPDLADLLNYYDELGSTNDEALRLATAGAAHGTVILAEHQLAGRGRRGSEWLSKPGDGLLFSVIIRPDYAKDYWSRLSLTTGLAIATCLRKDWQLQAEVKWPNDIYIRDKKCCGILVEAVEDFAIIGVGINVAYAPDGDFTSVWQELGKPVAREELLVDLVKGILKETFHCGTRLFSGQINRLRSMCLLTGKEISFQAGGVTRRGIFKGIGDSGEMLVMESDMINTFNQAESIKHNDLSI